MLFSPTITQRLLLLVLLLPVCRLHSSGAAVGSVQVHNPPQDIPSLSAGYAFQNWLSQHHGALSSPALDEGLSLARLRAVEMRALMASDPEAFLQRAIPEQDRNSLPAGFLPFIERRVKGRGSFVVRCKLPAPGQSTSAEKPSGLEYEARIDGRAYQAFVVGKWRSQHSLRETLLEGVALDDAIVFGDSPTPGEQDVRDNPQDAPSTTGPNKLLYMIARFSDETNAPISDSTALSQMGACNTFWQNNSAGVVSIRGLVNPGQVMDIVHIVLPRPMSYGPTYNQNFNQLLSEARSAASAQGHNYTNYNLDVVVTSNQGFSYAGHANLFLPGAHIVAPFTSLGVVGHELGHNLGLYHANYWRTDALAPYGKDSVPAGYVSDVYEGEWLEYGHYFSIMGNQLGAEFDDPTMPYYAPAEKAYLGWLSGNQVKYLNSGGTNRLFRFDHRGTLGIPRAIQITTPATDYTGNQRKYWLSYRYAPWNIAQDWFRNGVVVEVANYNGYDYDGAILLDMTPYSKDAATPFFNKNNKPGSWWTIDNTDKVDGALVVGRTFSDPAAGIHITPIATGRNGTNEEFIDIIVNLGRFPANQAPIISALSATTNRVATNQGITFSVTATDPDGDALAYSWDFGEIQTWTASGLNSSTALKSWSASGQYHVTVTVSDMKGGFAKASSLIAVGAVDGTREIWGRVIWGGRAVPDARVWVTSGSNVYQAWTTSDGAYALAGLPATNNYTVLCQRDGLTFAPQFSNPLSLTAASAYGKDFYANQGLPVGGLFLVNGRVTYAGTAVAQAEVNCGGRVTVTDNSGNYLFTNTPPGVFALFATKDDWSFFPSNRTVILISQDSISNNFARIAPYTISGRIDGVPAGPLDLSPRVYLSNGRAVQAVRETLGPTNYWTYMLTGAPVGQYSVSVERSAYRINPAAFSNPLSITGNLTNINFTGSAASADGAISGRITEQGLPLASVLVAVMKSGSNIGSGTTDSDGTYRIPNMTNGPYTLVPALNGYAFSPASNAIATIYSTYNFSASGSDTPPIMTAISAMPSVVPGKNSTALLSTAVNSGLGNFSCFWDAMVAPAPVIFTLNDSMSATSTVVSFQAPGNYTFRARVRGGNGLTTTSNVSLSVLAAPASMVVSPYQAWLKQGDSLAFHVDTWDELGALVASTPAWSTTPGGTIDSSGLFSATRPGQAQVTALAGTLSATGSVFVTSTNQIPVLALSALTNGCYLLRLQGLPGAGYRIESSENLQTNSWPTLFLGVADQYGFLEFAEMASVGVTRRYYRAVSF